MFLANKLNKGGSLSTPDAQFNYVTMLLHGDGTNGAQNNTFLDSSTNNFTITRNGNTTQGSFSPYGSNWSNYFDGSGDYLSVPDNSALEGFTDFTFECWLYVSDFASGDIVFAKGFGPGFAPYMFYFTSTDLVFYASSSLSSWDIADSQTIVSNIVKNQWYHVAASRSGSSIKLFANGAVTTSLTSSLTIGTTSTTFNVASAVDGTRNPEIYISNLRINNTALYTAAFTPSTTPLTAVSGTALLTCQSNRFIDNSTNAFTVSSFGNSSVQRFNPFGASTAYSTSVIGGSGYFDGSGDYLTVADNAVFNLGSSDFTLEGWVYRISASSQSKLVVQYVGGSDQRSWGVFLESSGAITLITDDDGLLPTTQIATSSGVLPLNAWTHIRVSRVGTTGYIGVNGTIVATGSVVSTIYNATVAVEVGTSLDGYMTDVRVVNGTALSTSSYTVPTAPLTAITNTALLCNFQNGAIYDNAMMNDLETVGNAQISTSVVKYGTGSIYFDGTGDWLLGQVSPNLSFGTGDFTIEGWGYVTSIDGTYRCIISIGAPVQIYARSGTIEVYFNDTDDTSTYIVSNMTGPASSVSANTWFHFAVVRNGTTFAAYVNGVAGTTTTGVSAQVALSAYPFALGIYLPSSSYPFTGYIDDLRITKGYARYTANFTPPTAAFSNTGPT